MIEISNPNIFFELQSNFDEIAFTQSLAWYNYSVAKGENVIFFVDDVKSPKIALFGRRKAIPIFGGWIFLIEGECYDPSLSERDFTVFYKKLTELNYKGIEINSNNHYNINFEIGLRRAGYVRPILSTVCPLTIEIDLKSVFDFDRNWMRNVKKAIQNDLLFYEITEMKLDTLNQIVKMFDEMAKLKNLDYLLENASLNKLVNSPGIRTFLVCDKFQIPLAARIIYSHNGFLSDVYAANSLQSRNCGATFFILNEILNLLKKEGNNVFDFGRIPPSNNASDSVYVFKNSSRGRKVQYNGEWIFYKSKWLEYLMFIYKQLYLKKQRF